MAPRIDLTGLNNLFKGDRARVNEWLELYLEEAPKMFEQMRSALRNGDVDVLARAAHELRPQAHYLGAGRMLVLLLAIEECARTQGAAVGLEVVEELLALGEAVEVDIRAALGRA